MELSVIIISYNVREYLGKALGSLLTSATGIDCELIVVDNNSSDGSAMMVRELYPGINLIVSDTNEGFAAACNKGIMASSGQFVLILNPDTETEPDCLRVSLDFMKRHPEAGAVGARMVNGDGMFLPESKRGFPSPLTCFCRFSRLSKLFPHSSFFNYYYLGHLPENEICRADILTGAYMFIRREALDKTGLFDTDFFMYGEDIDLSWRIVKAGYVNYYLPEARIIHYKGKSAPSWDKNRIRYFYSAMSIFAGKHLNKGWLLPVAAGVKFMTFVSLLSATFRKHAKKKSPRKK